MAGYKMNIWMSAEFLYSSNELEKVIKLTIFTYNNIREYVLARNKYSKIFKISIYKVKNSIKRFQENPNKWIHHIQR